MNTLYVLGGPPRTAKTTIMSALLADREVQLIAGDAVQHGLRNVLTGEPHQMLRGIELNGSAEFKTSISDGGERKPFSKKGTESELTLQAVLGMLDYYRRNQESVAFEGAMFTPAWVTGMALPDFTIRAAFVGYTNPSHADSVIAHAKANPHDWINVWLEKDNGDETNIREWIKAQAEACKSLKSEAEQQGYPFFDISTMPYEEYVAAVQKYFIS